MVDLKSIGDPIKIKFKIFLEFLKKYQKIGIKQAESYSSNRLQQNFQ
jgi:hypothetical protein